MSKYSMPHRSLLPQSVSRGVTSGTARTSYLKAAIVAALGMVLAWRPAMAIYFGKLVLRLWPNFRRA